MKLMKSQIGQRRNKALLGGDGDNGSLLQLRSCRFATLYERKIQINDCFTGFILIEFD
jgi:hypothetical protein